MWTDEPAKWKHYYQIFDKYRGNKWNLFCPLFCGGKTYANTPPLVSHANDPLNQDFQFWMCCTKEVNAVCLPPDGSQLWKAESSFCGRGGGCWVTRRFKVFVKKTTTNSFLIASYFPTRVCLFNIAIVIVIYGCCIPSYIAPIMQKLNVYFFLHPFYFLPFHSFMCRSGLLQSKDPVCSKR